MPNAPFADRLRDTAGSMQQAGEILSAQPPQQDHTDEWLIAFVLLLLLLGANAGGILTPAQRKRARTLLRSKYEVDTLRIAAAVAAGNLAVALWQAQLTDSFATYTRAMAIAGGGTMPVQPVLAAMEQRIAQQQPYLDGFAAQVDEGMTAPGISARSRMYGGVAYGGFWLAQGLAAGAGAMEEWIAVDDGGTCSVCASLNGQRFPAGQPPFPGDVCLGAGHCRCVRVPVR